MNETIRDLLKRRIRWCMAVGAAGFVVWLAVPLSATAGHNKPNLLFMFLGFALFGGALVCLQWAIKCPRCAERMGQEIAMRLGFSLFKKPPNFCPYCGVSFDEPRSGNTPAQPIQSQNPIK